MKKKKPSKKQLPEFIELYNMFGWVCPSCKTKNSNEGVFVEITRQERLLMADFYECDPSIFVTGEIVAPPEDVTCSKCNAHFKVKKQDLDMQ